MSEQKAPEQQITEKRASEDDVPREGYSLVGRYLLKKCIANHGEGQVYRAVKQEKSRETVAVKLLKPGIEKRFFETQVEVLKRVRSKHVPAIYDSGQLRGADDRHWIVMEWIEGETLSAYAKHGEKTWTPAECLKLLKPLFEVLEEFHTGKYDSLIVHGDLKPSNIMISGSSEKIKLYLLDFGISKIMDYSIKEGDTIATLWHSPDFMAPENTYAQKRERTPATDVHALGLILLWLLTGRKPYDADLKKDQTIKDGRYEQAADEIRPHERLGVAAGSWKAVFDKALKLKPSERYQTAGEFFRALEKDIPSEVTIPAPGQPFLSIADPRNQLLRRVAMVLMVLFSVGILVYLLDNLINLRKLGKNGSSDLSISADLISTVPDIKIKQSTDAAATMPVTSDLSVSADLVSTAADLRIGQPHDAAVTTPDDASSPPPSDAPDLQDDSTGGDIKQPPIIQLPYKLDEKNRRIKQNPSDIDPNKKQIKNFNPHKSPPKPPKRYNRPEDFWPT